MNFLLLLPYQIRLIIASHLNYSDLESVAKVCIVFDQILNQRFKSYKKFYDLITFNRKERDNKLN